MYCPDCGSKMRELDRRSTPHRTWDESSILFKCDDCEEKWVYETDTMDQGAKLVKIM